MTAGRAVRDVEGAGPPPLVLLAHGTHDPVGQAALEVVRGAVADRVVTTPVVLAHLGPGPAPVAEVVEHLDRGVVVPFLLGDGHHVEVDLPALADSHRGLSLTAALGPEPPVVAALADRVQEAADGPVGAVVLAAAGSSRPRARAQARLAGLALGQRLGVPVVTAFLSGPGTGVDEAVGEARRASDGGSVVLASYLLAPGLFQDRLLAAARRDDVPATAPIGAHPGPVGLVAARYRAAAAAAAG